MRSRNGSSSSARWSDGGRRQPRELAKRGLAEQKRQQQRRSRWRCSCSFDALFSSCMLLCGCPGVRALLFCLLNKLILYACICTFCFMALTIQS